MALASVALGGCGDGGSAAPTANIEQTTAAPDNTGEPVAAAVATCDDKEFEPDPVKTGLWPDAIWASVSLADCVDLMPAGVAFDVTEEQLYREDGEYGGLGYVIAVHSDTYAPAEGEAHQFSVSVVEAAYDGVAVSFADHVVADPGLYAEYLNVLRVEYDGAHTPSMEQSGYWDRAYGGPVAFEDAVMDASRLGELEELGPTYDPTDYYGELDGWGSRWYFALDTAVDALLLNFTFDGETRQIAFDLEQ
jgi:hypothetical protein